MIETKARAKRIDNYKWVFGQLLRQKNKYFIVVEFEIVSDGETTDLYATEWYEVIPETIGRYTGLLDRRGNEIYENDIIDHFATRGYVIYEDGMFTLNRSSKTIFDGYRQPLCYLGLEHVEVIGYVVSKGD